MAHALSTLLYRVGIECRIRSAVATILRPASDHGEAGVEELHQQTVALLSFTDPPVEIFGRRVAFDLSLSASPGSPGTQAGDIVREEVLRVLGTSAPDLSVQVIQAPVFHGHAYSLHVDLEESPSVEDLKRALALEGVLSIGTEPDEVSSADLADRTGIWVAALTAERDRDGSYWIWAVADAIRSGSALNAIRLAARIMDSRP
jgi:aspartate-semialdehyde dehydrogenase